MRPCHSLLFFSDVLLCDVKSHTALQQCQVSQFVMSSLTPPFINVKSHNSIVRNTEVLLPNFPLTTKSCAQAPLLHKGETTK